MHTCLGYFWLLHNSSFLTHKQKDGKRISNWNSLPLKKTACCYGETETRLTKQTFSQALCWFLNGLYSIIPSLQAGIIFQGFLASFSRPHKIRFLSKCGREEGSGKQTDLLSKSSLLDPGGLGGVIQFPSIILKNQRDKMGKMAFIY